MDEKKLKAIGDAMFQRFNLGNPETAGLKQAVKALLCQEMMQPVLFGCQILGPKEMIEVLRVFADGLELVVKEEENEKTG